MLAPVELQKVKGGPCRAAAPDPSLGSWTFGGVAGVAPDRSTPPGLTHHRVPEQCCTAGRGCPDPHTGGLLLEEVGDYTAAVGAEVSRVEVAVGVAVHHQSPESGRSLGAQKEGPSLPQGVGRGRVQKTPEQVRTAGSVASQAPH